MMNPIEYEEFIKKSINNMNVADALKWLEEKKYLLDQLEDWQQEEIVMWDVLCKVQQELWEKA